MCINAEPKGRGINARLTQNRFHKRYSTVTKNSKTIPEIRHILNIITVLNYVLSTSVLPGLFWPTMVALYLEASYTYILRHLILQNHHIWSTDR